MAKKAVQKKLLLEFALMTSGQSPQADELIEDGEITYIMIFHKWFGYL